jgi:hypothetical protein
VDQPEFLKLCDVPAEDGRADAQPRGQMCGAGFPLPHEAEDALQRNPRFQAARVGDGHASDGALEVEDLPHEFGRGVLAQLP